MISHGGMLYGTLIKVDIYKSIVYAMKSGYCRYVSIRLIRKTIRTHVHHKNKVIQLRKSRFFNLIIYKLQFKATFVIMVKE